MDLNSENSTKKNNSEAYKKYRDKYIPNKNGFATMVGFSNVFYPCFEQQ